MFHVYNLQTNNSAFIWEKYIVFIIIIIIFLFFRWKLNYLFGDLDRYTLLDGELGSEIKNN